MDEMLDRLIEEMKKETKISMDLLAERMYLQGKIAVIDDKLTQQIDSNYTKRFDRLSHAFQLYITCDKPIEEGHFR